MPGNFFSVGKDQWDKVCKLSLNAATALLVLARGTGRDNITTRWSADAVARHAGISWRRANEAIETLEKAQLAIKVSTLNKPPIRKLSFPQDLQQVLWLPNALVDGIGGKSSPVARLRQTQNVSYLQGFVELYGMQDLAGDGGLPRTLIRTVSTGECLCDAGQFRIYGFREFETKSFSARGPLVRFTKKRPLEDSSDAWRFLETLENLGLLEMVHYLAESEAHEAELIHALSGDEDAEALREAAYHSIHSTPEWVLAKTEQGCYEFVVPVLRHISAPAVMGVYRLVFRPHTKRTAAWWAKQRETATNFLSVYRAISDGDFKNAILP